MQSARLVPLRLGHRFPVNLPQKVFAMTSDDFLPRPKRANDVRSGVQHRARFAERDSRCLTRAAQAQLKATQRAKGWAVPARSTLLARAFKAPLIAKAPIGLGARAVPGMAPAAAARAG